MRALVALMMLTALHASATTWEVGPRPHGEVRFTVQGPLDDVPGITREVSGSFELDVKNVAQVKGNVAVPLDSLKTGIDQRDDDMRVQFLETAKERFGHTEKASEEKLRALLDPVDRRLKTYEEQVQSLEKQRVDAFGQLAGLIQSMKEGQQAVRDEAMRLSSALTNAPKARGRWGE